MSTVTAHRWSIETSETASGIRTIGSVLGRAFNLFLRAPANY